MTSRIPARSKRQAMDWSLALVSQGIEPVIENSPDDGWGLIVPVEEHEHAVGVIRQYRAENIRWPWRREFFRTEFLFDWGSLAWVFLVSLFFWLSSQISGLREAGLMDGEAVSRGEWWRLFTAIYLHADAGHIAMNAVLGFVLLGFAMGRFGTGIGLLAAYLTGAGGNAFAWLILGTSHRSLGASGMVMGSLGLLAAQSVPLLRRNPAAWKYVLSGTLAGIMLFVLFGLSPDTDVLAHLGGFLSGVILGSLLLLLPSVTQSKWTNLFGGLLFCILSIVPWWLALSKTR